MRSSLVDWYCKLGRITLTWHWEQGVSRVGLCQQCVLRSEVALWFDLFWLPRSLSPASLRLAFSWDGSACLPLLTLLFSRVIWGGKWYQLMGIKELSLIVYRLGNNPCCNRSLLTPPHLFLICTLSSPFSLFIFSSVVYFLSYCGCLAGDYYHSGGLFSLWAQQGHKENVK